MKYVIAGSLGNISRPLSQKLVSTGHDVTVITSNASRVDEIQSIGAKAAVGLVDDVTFLTKTFQGADGVYTMVPPNFAAPDWKKYIGNTGAILADAVSKSGIRKVVNLSSIGAHMAEGCGPVSGLYYSEKAFNDLPGVDVVHLRAGFFYSNFFGNVGMIKNMGIIGGNYGEGTKMILVHTNDIADVAARELTSLSFTGKNVVYVASDERTTDDIARVLGTAIGKPDLKWIDFTDDQTFGALKQAGLPEEIASNYAELGRAIRTGAQSEDYEKARPSLGPTRLEAFAKEFTAVYNA